MRKVGSSSVVMGPSDLVPQLDMTQLLNTMELKRCLPMGCGGERMLLVDDVWSLFLARLDKYAETSCQSSMRLFLRSSVLY